MATALDHLESYVSSPAIVGPLSAVTPNAPWAGLFEGASELFTGIDFLFRRAAAAPPSRGYEPWLVAHNCNRLVARMMAALIVRRANGLAKDNVPRSKVIEALKLLADCQPQERAWRPRVTTLLVAWKETSIIETIFDDAGADVFEFIRQLEDAAKGQSHACDRLSAIAASVIPYVRTTRGPKVAVESYAHEFFLEDIVCIQTKAPAPTPGTISKNAALTARLRRRGVSLAIRILTRDRPAAE
jgi:hypothetical protein